MWARVHVYIPSIVISLLLFYFASCVIPMEDGFHFLIHCPLCKQERDVTFSNITFTHPEFCGFYDENKFTFLLENTDQEYWHRLPNWYINQFESRQKRPKLRTTRFLPSPIQGDLWFKLLYSEERWWSRWLLYAFWLLLILPHDGFRCSKRILSDRLENFPDLVHSALCGPYSFFYSTRHILCVMYFTCICARIHMYVSPTFIYMYTNFRCNSEILTPPR